MRRILYVIQAADKSHCGNCGSPLDLLFPKIPADRKPMFYICWICCRVSEVGVGPIAREGEITPKRVKFT